MFISSKFQQQTWTFNHRVHRSFHQSPTTGNSRRNRKYLYRWNFYSQNWNFNGKSRFLTTARSTKVSPGQCPHQPPITGNSQRNRKHLHRWNYNRQNWNLND